MKEQNIPFMDGLEIRIMHVPSMITSICTWYFRDEEIFAIMTIISDFEIKLLENKRIKTKIDTNDCQNSKYGIIEIKSENSQIYSWDSEIVKCNSNWIGFESSLTHTKSIYTYWWKMYLSYYT